MIKKTTPREAVLLMLQVSEVAWKCDNAIQKLTANPCQIKDNCSNIKKIYKYNAIKYESLKVFVPEKYHHYWS